MKSRKIHALIDEIVNDGVPAVPPTKGKDLPTPPQLKYLKIVKMIPSVFHSDLPMNPHTKEGIVESYDSCDEYGLLGDEGDSQPDEVDSTKELCDDDIEDIAVSNEEKINKLIQSAGFSFSQ